MNDPDSFHCIITERALVYIKEVLLNPKEEPKAIVISSAGRIGGGYLITAISMRRINSMKYHIKLPLDNINSFGFQIFIEPLVLNGNFLPNPFVIDLVTKYNGELQLDVKNPAFETF